MDQNKFMNLLTELLETAAANGGQIAVSDVEQWFDEMNLGREQMTPIFRYLEDNQVRILEPGETAGPEAVPGYDEIGGMELVTPVFRGELESFLASDIPWICVLKTAGAVSRLEAFAATGRDFAARAGELREELLSSGDTQEVTVRARGDADALGALTSWAQEYAMQSR